MGWAQMVQGIVNGVTQLIQGRQQANELRTQADIEQFNIDNQRLNAQRVATQTSAREEQIRREARIALGKQRAAIAQSGTGMGGSNSALMAQSTANAELDALNVRYAGELDRLGIENDILMRTFNKQLLRKGAKNAMRMRWHNAGAAMFGAGTVSMQGGSSMPAASAGGYGQGSMMSFGNNMSNFMSMPGGSGGSNPYSSLSGYSLLGNR